MLIKTKYLILFGFICLVSCSHRDDIPRPGIPSNGHDYNAPYYPLKNHRNNYYYHYPYDYYNDSYYNGRVDDQYYVPIRKHDDNLDSNRDRAIN